MANQYGDDTEPGIITEESSPDNIISSDDSPSELCIVGPADLANARNAASENTVYQITRDSTAVDRFGPADSSLLTTAILDQMREGAAPIYAAVPSSTDVAGETHDTVAETTVPLTNAPTSEDPDDFTISLDGTNLTVQVTHEDVSTKSPGAGECYINPNTGTVEVNVAPDTTTGFSADYTHFDYVSLFDEIEGDTQVADVIDFLTAIQENQSVQEDVVATAKSLSQEQYYCIALIAPNAARIDPMNWTNDYDSSRVQIIYPTRFENGTSALAAYAGKRASLGLDRTAIRQRFSTQKQLAVSLSKEERGNLINNRVVPLENRVSGAVIKDDPTAVKADNTDESNIDFGFKRSALDYVYAVSEANEEPFIGRLHRNPIRNALADLIANQLSAMETSHVIEGYDVRIYEESATRARLELDIDAPEPLRFIENEVRLGSME